MKNIKNLIFSIVILSNSLNVICFDGYDLDTNNMIESYAPNGAHDDLDVSLQHSPINSRGNNTLMIAVLNSDYNDIETLLKDKRIDIDLKNDDGMTALHYAAGSGDGLILRLLLEYGARINVVDGQGNSPLHLASDANAFAVAQELVDHGADVSSINVDSKTPFDLSHNNRMKSILSEMY